jgi:hypothetical protein
LTDGQSGGAATLEAEESLAWPPQADLVLSAIETGQYPRRERRGIARGSYRVGARLRLYSDRPDTPAWDIYTRDANPRGLGFITPHRLPLGYGGRLKILCPDGLTKSIACTLFRCREAAPGWFEGSLYFNRHQPEFAV